MPNSLSDDDLSSLLEFFEILIEIDKRIKSESVIPSTPEAA